MSLPLLSTVNVGDWCSVVGARFRNGLRHPTLGTRFDACFVCIGYAAISLDAACLKLGLMKRIRSYTFAFVQTKHLAVI